MTDEATIDTQTPPAEDGTGAGADTATEETTRAETPATETAVGQPPAEVQPLPRKLTPEEIEERAFQRTASWTGRELKQFGDNILRNVTQVLEDRISRMPKGNYSDTPPPATIDPAAFLENPGQALRSMGYVPASEIPKILHQEIGRQTQADQRFNSDLIQHTAGLMDSDPLFEGDEGKKLGAEVIAEIQKGFTGVDKRLPATVAGQLLLSGSIANVIRRRTRVRTNPLAGNKPVGPGNGTISPPARTPAKEPAIKLDDMAKKVASWFGNTDEDIRVMLK